MLKALVERKSLILSANIILVVLFFILFGNSLPDICLYEDEADYVYAARKGFIANYLDSGTLPFATFLKLGISAKNSQASKTELSRTIRTADDISVFRHWHGPLYFYYLSMGKWIYKNNDQQMRIYSLMMQLFCALAVFWGCMLFWGKFYGIAASFLISLCVLGSTSLYYSTAFLSTHGIFTLCLIVCLFVLIKAIQSGKEMYYHLSAGIMGMVFLSNEYAALLMITWILSLVFAERYRKVGFKKIFGILSVSAASWLGVVFVFWPASLLKFSLLKSFVTQAYFMIYRGSGFSPMPVWKYWIDRFSFLPVDLGISFFGLILGLYVLIRKKEIILFPLICYMSLLLLTTFRNQSPNPTYTVTFVITGIVTAGFSLASLLKLKSNYKIGLLALMCLVQLSFVVFRLIPEQKNITSPKTELIHFLASEKPVRLLSVRYMMPIIRHYYPSINVDTYTAEIYSNEEGLTDVKNLTVGATVYDGMIFHGKNIQQYIDIISNHYFFETVPFSSTNEAEKWVYLRLKPKG